MVLNRLFISGGTSLVVQGLGLPASTAGEHGFYPSKGTRIPNAVGRGQKVKIEIEAKKKKKSMINNNKK